MSNDRSRGAALAAPSFTEGESQARDPWYDRLLQVLHLKPRDSLREGLEEALAEPDPGENGLSPLERAMLKNVLGLHKVRVDDVMVPRADILAVSNETSLGELLKLFRSAGHSRLPVYAETLDDPRGMVHIRDLVDHIAAKAEPGARRGNGAAVKAALPDALALPSDGVTDPVAPVPRTRRPAPRLPRGLDLGKVDLTTTLAATRIQRPVLFVPPSMPAIDLLVRMQATRTHMALVIDEYGGTDGLISIEDLIEVVVGDIEDEHDVAEAKQVQRVEGEADVFVADARTPLADVSEATGVDLAAAVGEMAEEIDTLGGMIVTLAGRVPSRGELIAGPGDLEFEVLDADPRRLKRLRFHRGAARITAVVPLALPPPVGPQVGETPHA